MKNVFETIAESARRWARRPAIIERDHVLDYRSLWREVEALRAQLDAHGVRAGQGVGVLARNGRAFIIAVLGALGCDAVVMPIYFYLKPDELSQMLARAGLGLIIDNGECPPLAAASCQPLEPVDGQPLRLIRVVGHCPAPLVPDEGDAAFVRFTSGTTGAAKGVILTHAAVLERTRAANAGLRLGCEDKVVWVLPMAYHFFASIILYLQVGAAVVVSPDHLAENVLEAATRHAATFLYAAPMHVRFLAALGSTCRLPATLRRVMSVSSRLPGPVARAFHARFGVPVSQGYGVIEIGLPIMNLEDAAACPEAIGRPLPDFEVGILDDALRPVVDGQTGQLAVRGPGMFAGYLSPRLTRQEVLRAGWFLTGDLAHRNNAGLITIAGRSSSVIHVAGHKVFPEDIAAVLDQHPAVCRSRVTTRSHPQLGELVHAEVQLRADRAAIATEDLLAFCRDRLSSYKVPASIALVPAVDQTPSGKVRHG
jgi:acyl-CoA synthetase (AMP-forming)/AMP-acid ligase II